MIVILFGPPGAGKGTQAGQLCADLGVTQVATGDIFRKNLKEGTELGQLARSYMDRGALVPDEVVWKLVEDRLGQPDLKQGVLLDGFPRTVRQAELMLGWSRRTGRAVDAVVALVVEDETLIARLSGRRTCIQCGATYHVQHNPAQDGICSACGSQVVQRDDDSEQTVRSRLATYHRETEPVLAFFDGDGLVRRVDGTGEIGVVANRIRAALR